MIVFDEILTPYHTQQQSLQLQSIAHHNYVPIDTDPTLTPRRSASINSRAGTPLATPHLTSIVLPFGPNTASSSKAHVEPLTPAGSVDGGGTESLAEFTFPPKREREEASVEDQQQPQQPQEPPKKKRRVALTRVGDV